MNDKAVFDVAGVNRFALDAYNVLADGFTASWNELPNRICYYLTVATSPLFFAEHILPNWNNAHVYSTNQVITGLAESVTYYYKLKARYTDGTYSDDSQVIEVTTATPSPDDSYFVFDANDQTITLYYKNGKYDTLPTQTDVVIPAQIGGVDVKIIGSHAFDEMDSIETLDIQADLQLIDSYAFAGCASMHTLQMNAVRIIAKYAFRFCNLSEITIPSDTIEITQGAFEACPIVAINMYEGIVNIDNGDETMGTNNTKGFVTLYEANGVGRYTYTDKWYFEAFDK